MMMLRATRAAMARVSCSAYSAAFLSRMTPSRLDFCPTTQPALLLCACTTSRAVAPTIPAHSIHNQTADELDPDHVAEIYHPKGPRNSYILFMMSEVRYRPRRPQRVAVCAERVCAPHSRVTTFTKLQVKKIKEELAASHAVMSSKEIRGESIVV